MANVNLGIQVVWTGNNVEANLDGIDDELKRIRSTVEKMSAAFAASTSRIERSSRRASVAVGGLGRQMSNVVRGANLARIAILGFGIQGVGRMAAQVTRGAGEFQALLAQLTFSEGSFSDAENRIASLAQTFATFGISLSEGTARYSQFTALGVENSDRLVVAIGKLASISGRGEAAFDGISVAISQMFAKGQFVRAEEFTRQLSDQIPTAAAIAAEGFRRMGNTSLDSAEKITGAVYAGTLRVDDFVEALTRGSDAVISNSQAVGNAATQMGGLISNLRAARDATVFYNGVSIALGVTFNALSEAVSDYTSRLIEGFGDTQQQRIDNMTAKVQELVIQFLDVAEGIEIGLRVGVRFVQIMVAGFTQLFQAAHLVGVGIATQILQFQRGIAALKGDTEGVVSANQRLIAANEEIRDTFERMGSAAGDFNDALTALINNNNGQGWSPITDEARNRVKDVQQIVEDIMNQTGPGPGQRGEGAPTGAQATALNNAERALAAFLDRVRNAANRQELPGFATQVIEFRDRFEELSETLRDKGGEVGAESFALFNEELSQLIEAGTARELDKIGDSVTKLNDKFARLTARGGQDRIAEAAAKAALPYAELENQLDQAQERAQRLSDGLVAIGESNEGVMQSVQEISNMRDGLAAARAQAVAYATEMARIDEQMRVLKNNSEALQAMQGLRDAAISLYFDTNVGLISRQMERIIDIEDDLMDRRMTAAQNVLEADRLATQARYDGNVQLALAFEMVSVRNTELLQKLNELNPAIVEATRVFNELLNKAREAISSGISDAIFGLVTDGMDFDFSAIGQKMIDDITRSITDNWGERITDLIFGGLGIGKDQMVRNMTVTNMNVMGTGIGGAAGAAGGLFGGGGVGGLFSGIGKVFNSIPFFAKGGVVGGPTLAGIGEGGDPEAVLPLERMGGKLGVAAGGLGGDQFHINIQAIDTQSGAEFLHRNAPQIVGELRRQSSLATFRGAA